MMLLHSQWKQIDFAINKTIVSSKSPILNFIFSPGRFSFDNKYQQFP